MPDLESIIEAILRGRFKDAYDTMSKVDLWAAKSEVLSMLIPAMGAIEEIKARIWDEGVEAQDEYLLKSFVGEDVAKPTNPYRTTVV